MTDAASWSVAMRISESLGTARPIKTDPPE